MTEKTIINGDSCHELLTENTVKKFAYRDDCDFEVWRKNLREELMKKLGLDKIAANACAPDSKIEEDIVVDDYTRIRLVFESEKGSFVPCYLLIPRGEKKKYPVAITLQGHSSGFRYSIGENYGNPNDDYLTRGDFGRQAVKNGYAALCIEQRAMGERVTSRHTFREQMCLFQSMTAIMLGRTVIGERVWDVMRAVDLLHEFAEVDFEDVFITGNSGGGTTSFYAACIDERIKLSAPSCAFCSYDESIMKVYHCTCNYIPGAREYFDMGDLAGLIAPRKLIIIAGKDDPYFLLKGVKDSYATVEKIYERIGAPHNCELIVTDKAHWWCKDVVWQAINSARAKNKNQNDYEYGKN